MPTLFDRAFSEAAACLDDLRGDQTLLAGLETLADQLTACFLRGDKVLVAGNGGSMADAAHFAEEWTGRFRSDRRPWPVLALSEPGHLTCVGNDYGFDHVFERGVRAFARQGDIVLLLSTSGRSRNLVLAAGAAKSAGSLVVGFVGRGGGELAPVCDLALHFPGEAPERIQELQMLALHALIEVVEARLLER